MRETQYKGDVAVSQAIATFTRLGMDVSIPLTESASYDLIVDTNKRLVKVQVRYSGARQVALRRIHSNSKGYVVKPPKTGAYDWLYILKSSGEEYLVKQRISNRNSLVPREEDLLPRNTVPK